MQGLLGHSKDLTFILNRKTLHGFEFKVTYILRGSFQLLCEEQSEREKEQNKEDPFRGYLRVQVTRVLALHGELVNFAKF